MFCLAVYVFAWEREKGKKIKTFPGTFGYSCREGPVSDFTFRGRWHSTVNPSSNFKKQIVDDRFWLWDQIVQPDRLLYSMRRCVHLLCLEVSSTEIFPDKTNLSLQEKEWAEAAAHRVCADWQDVVSSRFWEPHSAILLLHALLHFDDAVREAKETFFSAHLPTSSLKSYSIVQATEMKKL